MKNFKVVKYTIGVLFLINLSACGQTNNVTEAVNQEGSVTVTDFTDRSITFYETPKKIVALGNGDLDIIYALDEVVIGRPNETDEPIIEDAVEAEEVGTTHEINYEKIALLAADVVLANSGLNEKDVPTIEAIGTKVILTHANSIEDIKNQITLYGDLLDQKEKAINLNTKLDNELEGLQKSVNSPRVLLVYGAPGTYMAALDNSLSGDILKEAGGMNIASEYPTLKEFPQYAQINTEHVVDSDPDLVLLITHGNTEEVKKGFIKEMEQNAAWNNISAVEQGNINVLPSDLFGTNPGTRVVEAVSYMVDILNDLE
ncbi:ABC transporter substrate-binding protein [Paraliobacillus sediminis]|uniref:ABC transporter substrate-binding protein n=1 Tax=Paraliobacillus sediminis TaxID=1885916 RepID=UPI000E3E2973|nr:ABC transporter substrate-binding protein [Paraliobacillus sediminis]